MQAKDLKINDKFKLIGQGKWNQEMEVIDLKQEDHWNKPRVVITLKTGKIKLHPKQEVALIN